MARRTPDSIAVSTPGGIDAQTAIALLVVLAVFAVHAASLDFTQDDAYISFRYVKNFVSGHGLVFNPGERVEGYTNFLWIVLLSIFAGFGLEPVVVSKFLGGASGCLSILVLYRLSTLYFGRAAGTFGKPVGAPDQAGPTARLGPDDIRLLALFPPLLLAGNGAFAYWSISGLETPLFVLGVLTTFYFHIVNRRLAVVTAAVTSLVRPEGVLLFLVLLCHRLIAERESIKSVAAHLLGFVALLLPFLGFRLVYYGDLLPNPFYAKTGLAADYVTAGLSYFARFLKHYGFLGAVYVLPVIAWRRLAYEGRLLWISASIYSVYVIVVGGDVLRGHRFLLPVIALLYPVFCLAVASLAWRLKARSAARVVCVIVLVACASVTFALPRNAILEARKYEMGLSSKLTRYALRLKRSFGSDFTLAISTIGVISYLSEARVIDMLGLTDPYIAKHPEHLPGLTSSWKERNFNAGYLLSREPDFIMFSTGLKPSAPAEKALFLHSKFRRNYYLYSLKDIGGRVYKRKGDFAGVDSVYHDPTFIDLYAQALHLGPVERRYEECIATLDRMIAVAPADFARGYEFAAACYSWMGNFPAAEEYAKRAVEIDEYSIEAHSLLHDLYLRQGKAEAARSEAAVILKYNPEVARRDSP